MCVFIDITGYLPYNRSLKEMALLKKQMFPEHYCRCVGLLRGKKRLLGRDVSGAG